CAYRIAIVSRSHIDGRASARHPSVDHTRRLARMGLHHEAALGHPGDGTVVDHLFVDGAFRRLLRRIARNWRRTDPGHADGVFIYPAGISGRSPVASGP